MRRKSIVKSLDSSHALTRHWDQRHPAATT
jgi:hypothetical protein